MPSRKYLWEGFFILVVAAFIHNNEHFIRRLFIPLKLVINKLCFAAEKY
jgi:hypothetical protein